MGRWRGDFVDLYLWLNNYIIFPLLFCFSNLTGIEALKVQSRNNTATARATARSKYMDLAVFSIPDEVADAKSNK